MKIEDYEPCTLCGNVPILIGHDRKGKLIYVDLSKGQPHMLIAGETGSGKSTALRSIITNLLLTTNVKLTLIDLKMGAEFNIFKDCKHIKAFARNRSQALMVLNEAIREVDYRYNLFFKAGVVDIAEYNRQEKVKIDYEAIIIDEFADLMDDKESIRLLEIISAKARACGIHLILATQRPDAKVLNGRIKANVAVVLGLKTKNVTNSQIVIDKPGLEKLNGKGNGILCNGYEIEVQCPYLSTEKAKKFLAPIIEPKKVEKDENIDNFDFLEGSP